MKERRLNWKGKKRKKHGTNERMDCSERITDEKLKKKRIGETRKKE